MDVRAVELGAGDAREVCALQGACGIDREPSGLRAALANTDLALGLRRGEELLAAARVITDATYVARVYDVAVAPEHRRRGLGTALMRTVLDHGTLDGVDIIELRCREELVPFYEGCGFAVDEAMAGDATHVRMVR